MQKGITTTGQFEVARIDKLSVNMELKKYKDKNGAIDFLSIREIPQEERIYSVAKRDLGSAVKLVAVAITLAMEGMNLTRPLTAFQILDISETVIEESESDSLTFPDLMLFLQRLVRGYYPGLYEGIDQLKFMERFNQYRDERFEEMKKMRDEKHDYYKGLGDSNHFERHNPKDTTAFGGMMEHYRTKAQVNRDEKRERKNYDR